MLVQVLAFVSVTIISALAVERDVVYYLETPGHRLVKARVEIIDGQRSVIDCRLYGDSNIIKKLLETVKSKDIISTSPSEMSQLIEECQDKPQSPNVVMGVKGDLGLNSLSIFPGTKWCGAGNIAENYDDLGEEKATDMCCREHDHCDDNIEAGATKNGLKNTDMYTRSHCACDNKLYDCQHAAGTKTSSDVGTLYFNLLQIKCFNLSHPIEDCLNYRFNFLRMQCQEYKVDKTKAPIWQFFDARYFY